MRSWMCPFVSELPLCLVMASFHSMKTQIRRIQSKVYEICIYLGWRWDHILGIVGGGFQGLCHVLCCLSQRLWNRFGCGAHLAALRWCRPLLWQKCFVRKLFRNSALYTSSYTPFHKRWSCACCVHRAQADRSPHSCLGNWRQWHPRVWTLCPPPPQEVLL